MGEGYIVGVGKRKIELRQIVIHGKLIMANSYYIVLRYNISIPWRRPDFFQRRSSETSDLRLITSHCPAPEDIVHADAGLARGEELFLIGILRPLAAQLKERIDRAAYTDMAANGEGNEIERMPD